MRSTDGMCGSREKSNICHDMYITYHSTHKIVVIQNAIS